MRLPGFALSLAVLSVGPTNDGRNATELERIVANDNTHSAGSLHNGRLDLNLDVTRGRWFPEAENGLSTPMLAFAERGRAPGIPGPLIRVPQGTEIHAVLRNTLDSTIFLHGFGRAVSGDRDMLKLLPGETREVAFRTGTPGTYFYWAATRDVIVGERTGNDSQLAGAIIVDSGGAHPPPRDRVFVLGLWTNDRNPRGQRTYRPREFAVINGKSWPYTERFSFSKGDSVFWRWINPTNTAHPLHLHGFYFTIDRVGTAGGDRDLAASEVSQNNTRAVNPGGTMSIHFVLDRPGNWLFHCHVGQHVDGDAILRNVLDAKPIDLEKEIAHSDAERHMAGMVLGISIRPRSSEAPGPLADPRLIRLLIQASPHRFAMNPAWEFGPLPAYGFVVQNGAEPRRDSVDIPGPTLVLEKGKPVAITVVNRLKMMTAVHWHGMEIESYPDGAAGWSGSSGRIFPGIAPGDSFVARFTPPRAGTFIYHAHIHEVVQTNAGMYGALIVTDSTHRYDPTVDRIVIAGGGGPGSEDSRTYGTVNGRGVSTIELVAGVTHRLRLISINPQTIIVHFKLGTDTSFARWTPVAKDGADLPLAQSTSRPAFVALGTGETEDFLFTPERPGTLRLDIATNRAGWHALVQVNVRPKGSASTLPILVDSIKLLKESR